MDKNIYYNESNIEKEEIKDTGGTYGEKSSCCR